MPIYTYRCPECGETKDQYNRIADRHTNLPDCCGPMKLKIVPTMVYVDVNDYICPVTKEHVTTKAQRQRIMAEHDLVDANDFKPAQFMAQKRAEREATAREAREAGISVTLDGPAS